MTPPALRAGLAATALLALALAGCTGDDHAAEDRPHYTLTLPGAPGQVVAGEETTFALAIDGDEATSDHIGAHFWDNSTNDPDGDFALAATCQHQAGDLPGTFQVTCTFPREGTVHLRGHMRDGDGVNWWTAEHAVQVVGL